MSKNIVIFSDGTGQAGGLTVDERRSNIYKLYRATRVGHDSAINPAEQLAYYDAGLGSRSPSGGLLNAIYRKLYNLVSGATGFGITANITDCYEMIIRYWRPGDRIFLFGFSRGAYTARCVGGVLSLCGVPTRLSEHAPMKYDAGTTRALATEAVKKVYQHTASKPLSGATPRELELMDQRRELARLFREKHGVDQSDKSHYPYFIGVFDTVAAMARPGALALMLLLALALAAGAATVLKIPYPAYEHWFGRAIGNTVTWIFGLVGGNPENWWLWFAVVSAVFALILAVWYGLQAVRFAPSANPRKPWRTLTVNWGRMSFEDKTLNDNVEYARHAISIDEDRATFKRVPWGGFQSKRPKRDERDIITFEQYWFAGNHSDIGGGYAETESRLSDIALNWMVEAASGIIGGIKIDKSSLSLHPSADGVQHDERKRGFPLLTKWLGITWRRRPRDVPGTDATLHETVIERAALVSVLQYDTMAPYRPESLRNQRRLASFYATTSGTA